MGRRGGRGRGAEDGMTVGIEDARERGLRADVRKSGIGGGVG